MKDNRKLPFILMSVFTILLVVGINLGEASAVFQKAVKICLSCIGIG